jgi:hypothetical protein
MLRQEPKKITLFVLGMGIFMHFAAQNCECITTNMALMRIVMIDLRRQLAVEPMHVLLKPRF